MPVDVGFVFSNQPLSHLNVRLFAILSSASIENFEPAAVESDFVRYLAALRNIGECETFAGFAGSESQ